MRKFILGVALASFAVLFTAANAKAAFMLEYSTTGTGGPFTVVTGSATFITTTVDGLTVQATASNSATIQSTTFDLGVNGTATGAVDLVVRAWLSNIPTAPAPQTLTFNFTGSVLPPTSGTLTEHTWVQSDNTTAFSLSGNLANTGALTPNASGSITFNGTVPYSATVENHFTLTAGASISSDNNNIITSVPAPAGLVLVLSGLPLLGLGGWLRRRTMLKA
jgi:hypothetical protein